MGEIFKLLVIFLVFLWCLSFFVSEEGQERVGGIGHSIESLTKGTKDKVSNIFK